MTAKSGKSFDATLQVNAEKKGIEFIFEENKSLKERQEQRQDRQQSKASRKLCGLELSEKQREALDNGRTLYLKNIIDKEGQPFNAYVRMDKERKRPRTPRVASVLSLLRFPHNLVFSLNSAPALVLRGLLPLFPPPSPRSPLPLFSSASP